MLLFHIDYIMSLYNSTKSQNRTNFKIVIVGERGAGKTSLALRYIKGIFNKMYTVTVGVQFYSKIISRSQQNFCLHFWDTAGQESFRSLVKSFYNNASCVILTYCNPNQMSKKINSYLEEIGEHAASEALVYVVRTKTDLSEITEQQRIFLNDLLKKQQIAGWMDVSAKQGKNIYEFFQTVADNLIDKFKDCMDFRLIVEPPKLSNSIYLTKQSVLQTTTTKSDKKKRCCQ